MVRKTMLAIYLKKKKKKKEKKKRRRRSGEGESCKKHKDCLFLKKTDLWPRRSECNNSNTCICIEGRTKLTHFE